MMTTADIEAVLGYVGATDSRVRRKDPAERTLQVQAWLTQLAGCEPADVRAAVDQHYADGDADALLPGRVRALVKGIRADRLRAAVEPAPAADPDDTQAYLAGLRANRSAIAAGRFVPARPAAPLSPAELEARFGNVLPSMPGRRRESV